MSRGRSVEPELVQMGASASLRRPPPPNRFDRSRSAGPRTTNGNRASRYLPPFDEDMALNAEADRAMINQHVNPYQEFPSLRRGFTLRGQQMAPPVEEEIKIRGEGDACAYYFWAITLFFFALALLNFVVLIAIVLVLGIGPEGFSSVEFLHQDGSIKFLKDVLAPDITLSGVLSGYADEPMTLVSENGDVFFQVMDSNGVVGKMPEMRISKSEIVLSNVDSFRVVDPDTGKIIFDAQSPEFQLDESFESLSVNEMETNRIVSPIDKDLLIQSDAGLDLVGTEGISVESKSVCMDAGENIIIESGSIVVDGDVSVDPLALPLGGGGYPGEKQQYKLCICSPSGKLFSVPAVVQFQKVTCQTMLPHWEKHP